MTGIIIRRKKSKQRQADPGEEHHVISDNQNDALTSQKLPGQLVTVSEGTGSKPDSHPEPSRERETGRQTEDRQTETQT